MHFAQASGTPQLRKFGYLIHMRDFGSHVSVTLCPHQGNQCEISFFLSSVGSL